MSRLDLVLCALIALAAAGADAQQKNPDGLPILLLSGGQREHHGYRDQANGLARNIEETGRYRVTIVEDAAVLETPAMGRYRAVIVLADRRDPEFRLTLPQQRALLDFVRSRGDGGLVSLHAADNAAADWVPEMRQMLGGVFSHDTSQGRPDGKVRKGRYRVEITDADHPITAGVESFELDDELYYHMQMEPDVAPLATVAHEGYRWPVAWTRAFGRGRVFHTLLGHRDFGPEKHDPLQDTQVRRLVLHGLDWVVASRPGESTQEPAGSGE